MIEKEAIYTEQIVPDYRNNPLIESLPPIWGNDEVIDMLSHNEGFNEGERQLDPRYRMHCILRLFRCFQPLEQHIDIERRFSCCIRQGYLHRWHAQIGEPTLADAVVDRIVHDSYTIVIEGKESMRKRKGLTEES